MGYLRNVLPGIVTFVLTSGWCFAADVGITPTKLIVVDRGAAGAKVVFVAKDSAISKGTGTDAATIHATFDVLYDNNVDPATRGQFNAPAGSLNWLLNDATVAKYVNRDAPAGAGSVGKLIIKPGSVIKLVANSLGDTPLNIMTQGGTAGGVARLSVRISDSATAFDDSFCSVFTPGRCVWRLIGGGTGAKLACKVGSADDSCTINFFVPCDDGVDPCGPNGTCNDQLGAPYTCTCAAGYEEVGGTCVDVNECDDGVDPCGPNGTCNNQPGAPYTCSCATGYLAVGDPVECVACPEGADCTQPGTTCANVEPLVGWWTPGIGCPPTFYRCLIVQACDPHTGG